MSPVAAAGVFTTNLAQAAPVQVSRRHLADGRAAAVVLSSGNANAATGEPGRRDARAHVRRWPRPVCRELCAADDVLVCSTGLIGIPMPMDALETGIPKLCDQLARRRRRSRGPGDDDDRHEAEGSRLPRPVARDGRRHGQGRGDALARDGDDARGAHHRRGRRTGPSLQRALAQAVSETFDCLSVDGCRSTNDTVLVLANGRAGAVDAHALTGALTEVCGSLAEQMARDAEGATKFVRVRVVGARNDAEARIAARAVANSQLVQCSLNGNDPYWGRVLSELGASGAHLDPEAVDISYNGVTVCRDGVACAHDEAAVTRALAGIDIEILCDLRTRTR